MESEIELEICLYSFLVGLWIKQIGKQGWRMAEIAAILEITMDSL